MKNKELEDLKDMIKYYYGKDSNITPFGKIFLTPLLTPFVLFYAIGAVLFCKWEK